MEFDNTMITQTVNIKELESKLENQAQARSYFEIKIEEISGYGSSVHYRVMADHRILGTFFRMMGKKEWSAMPFYQNGEMIDENLPIPEKIFSSSRKAKAYLVQNYLAS